MRRKLDEMNKFFKNQIPANGSVSVLLYGNVGDGEKVDSERVVTELLGLAAQYGKINVHINSKGGDVYSGIAIYNALRSVKAEITIYVDGVAASIASVIALCGKPLYMSKYARLMLHRVSGMAYGTADEMREMATQAESLEQSIAEMVAKRCKMTVEQVSAKYFDGKDHWITAQEALSMGIIDGTFDAAVDDLTDASDNEAVYGYFTNRLMDGFQEKRDLQAKYNNNMTLIEELKKRPGFCNLADDGAMLAHIAKLENQAVKATALEAKVTDLTTKLEAQETAANKSFLNQARAEGKITAEQVDVYLNLMKADKENVMKLINAMKPASGARATAFLNLEENSGVDPLLKMSWDELDKADQLGEFKAKFPEQFENMYKSKFNIQ